MRSACNDVRRFVYWATEVTHKNLQLHTYKSAASVSDEKTAKRPHVVGCRQRSLAAQLLGPLSGASRSTASGSGLLRNRSTAVLTVANTRAMRYGEKDLDVPRPFHGREMACH